MLEMYKQSETADSGHEKLGEYSIERFMELVQALSKFSEAEESVGIVRTKKDYIDISFNGNNTYVLFADHLSSKRSIFKKLFSRPDFTREFIGLHAVKEVIEFYVSEDRDTFELKYV